MKFKGTIIFVITVVIILLASIIFVPKIFPKISVETSSNQTSKLQTSVMSKALKTYSIKELVAESDNVLSGTVIKADVFEEGILYTITVSWADVFKGRNYATMGYAYLKGPQTLELNKTYMFIGDTGEEKYQYYEPFKNAPWVFEINEDKTLTHISNGDIELLKEADSVTVELLKSICESEDTDSK